MNAENEPTQADAPQAGEVENEPLELETISLNPRLQDIRVEAPSISIIAGLQQAYVSAKTSPEVLNVLAAAIGIVWHGPQMAMPSYRPGTSFQSYGMQVIDRLIGSRQISIKGLAELGHVVLDRWLLRVLPTEEETREAVNFTVRTSGESVSKRT